MGAIEHYIQSNVFTAWGVIILSFVVLFKSADIFVEASVGLAERFRVPRLVIGIVLVSLATTAPELTVSLMAALRGNPEIALGNAIGSVICDDGLALGLAGVCTVAPIVIVPSVLKSSGVFLIAIQLITFLFVARDFTLERWEGVVLVMLFAGYICFLFRQHARGELREAAVPDVGKKRRASAVKLLILFICALAGIIVASEFVITSAITIARSFHISEGVIALTLVALGTSVPEVATCITAARKGEGAIAVGNILGADIMNICWVAGASAIAHDLTLGKKDIMFMFPSMFIIVGVMLVMLRMGYTHSRSKGLILFCLYLCYLVSFFVFFPPQLS